MQHVIRFFIILLLLGSLPACSGKKEQPAAPEVQQDAAVTETTTLPGAQAEETAADTQPAGDAAADKAALPDTGKELARELASSVAKTAPPAATDLPPASRRVPGFGEERAGERRELSGNELGQIIFLQGEVTVARDGNFLNNIDFGTGVENYDVIRTGSLSATEIEINQEDWPASIIAVSENTSFALELDKEEEVSRTTFEILTGSLALKVDKLRQNQELNIKSDQTVIGVRGTVFSVASVPSGDLLVTCKEGKVICKDAQGHQVEAVPGKAVEKSASGDFSLINLAGRDADIFLDNWWAEKVQVLKKDALAQIKKNAQAYDTYYREFTAAYTDLKQEADIITRWKNEDLQGIISSTAALIMQDKKAIVGHLFAIRQSLVGLNRVYQRLMVLKKYHDQGFGVGNLANNRTTTRFFTNLEKDDPCKEIVDVLYIQKLFSLRNAGTMLLQEFEGMDSVNDFFDSTDDLFKDLKDIF